MQPLRSKILPSSGSDKKQTGSASNLQSPVKRPATSNSTSKIFKGSKSASFLHKTAPQPLLTRETHRSTESLLVARTSVGQFSVSQKWPTVDVSGSTKRLSVDSPVARESSSSRLSVLSVPDSNSVRRKGFAGSTHSAAKDRQILLEVQKRDLRKNVLAGDFMNGCYDEINDAHKTTANIWMLRKWQLLVFVSSTFTDTRCERNILLDRILPQLREMGIPYDIEVTFVDMRWGISDDHTVDHKTWDECQREIARCKENSSGLFFISLQSDKYGYRPLPRKIDKRNFEDRLHSCADQALLDLAKEWYVDDLNNIPEIYVLKKLESVEDTEYFDHVLPTLRTLLQGIRFDKAVCRDVACGKSVSEWEVKFALKNEDDASRSLWIQRDFSGCCEDDKNYSDTVSDEVAAKMLRDLKDYMARKIGKAASASRIQVHNNISYHSLTDHDVDYQRYCEKWERRTLQVLTEELQAIIRLRWQWDYDGCDMGLAGHVAAEFLHHAKWAHDCCREFFGRESLLTFATELFRAPNRRVVDPRNVYARAALQQQSSGTNQSSGRYNGISFVVTGAPGSGKSGVMAKLADAIYKSEVERWTESAAAKSGKAVMPARPVIIRFCGTSDNSLDSEALMKSLRVHIEYLLGPIKRKSEKQQSNWEYLFDALNHHAVVVLIDSVDSLVDGFDFLKDINPHQNTRIIISTTKPSDPKSPVNVFTKENIPVLEVPQLSVNPTTSLSTHTNSRVVTRLPLRENQTKGVVTEPSEIQVIIEQFLASRSRRLTPRQMDLAVTKVAEEPNILYLSLVCRIVEHWSSHLTNPVLESKLEGIFSQIMTFIEHECGVKMSRLALSLITFSVRGINDNEMEDLLSLDDTILYSIFSYDYPGVFRVPSHVWTRLRMSLSGLMVERVHGCLSWHHKELQALAKERYAPLEPEEKKSIHQMLGVYFGNRVPQSELDRKKIAPSPRLIVGSSIWLDTCKPNQRRCEEAAYSLILAGMYSEAADELCNFENICATAKCGQGLHYVSTLRMLSAELNNDSANVSEELCTRVEDYLKWTENSIIRIMVSPSAMIPVTVTAEPEASLARQDFMTYMESTQTASVFTENGWIRGICPSLPPPSVSGPVCINCVKWSPDDSKLVCGSDDHLARVWDSNTGCITMTLDGHTKAVTCADWRPDGSVIVTGSRDCSAILWNAASGAMLRILSNGHTMDLICVAYSPNGLHIATGSKDSKVMVWRADDEANGEKVTYKKFNDYYISCVRWSPDGKFLAASTFTNTVRVWDIEAKKAKVFTEAQHQISSLCWGPSGDRVASASDDGCVSIWSPHQPTTVFTVFREHRRAVRSVAWSPELGRIVSGDIDGGTLLWDASTGEILTSLSGHGECVNDLQWNSTGSKIASVSKDGKLILWDSTDVS